MLAEFLPLSVADHGDKYLFFVPAIENVINCPSRYPYRHGRGRFAGYCMLRHVLADQEGRAFKQSAVNPLPAAGAAAHFQGRQDADDSEHATYHVDHRCAGA